MHDWSGTIAGTKDSGCRFALFWLLLVSGDGKNNCAENPSSYVRTYVRLICLTYGGGRRMSNECFVDNGAVYRRLNPGDEDSK